MIYNFQADQKTSIFCFLTTLQKILHSYRHWLLMQYINILYSDQKLFHLKYFEKVPAGADVLTV